MRETDVVARMGARPRPGRPAGAAGRQGADELDGDDACAAGSLRVHELYEACRAQCEFRPSMAELESLQSDEERAHLDDVATQYSLTYERLCVDAALQDSCVLCIIQIGEAIDRLSDEFKREHP